MKDLFGNKINPPRKARVVRYRDFNGEPTMRVLSLGAGVQSSTLLYMIHKGELPRPDHVIFADTQWEPRAVYDHLDYLRGLCSEINAPLHVVSKGNIREMSMGAMQEKRFPSMPFWLRNKDGKAGRLKRQCTADYKIKLINQKIRELLGMEKGQRVPLGWWVEQWIGISYDEIYRMKLSGVAYIHLEYPLVHRRMRRESCLEWCDAHAYKTPPKSSCKGCPFHDDAFWQDMKTNSPDEFADACDFDEQIRNGLRGVNMPAYLHESLIPLAEIDFSANIAAKSRAREPVENPDQLPIFGPFADECSGMCGV